MHINIEQYQEIIRIILEWKDFCRLLEEKKCVNPYLLANKCRGTTERLYMDLSRRMIVLPGTIYFLGLYTDLQLRDYIVDIKD